MAFVARSSGCLFVGSISIIITIPHTGSFTSGVCSLVVVTSKPSRCSKARDGPATNNKIDGKDAGPSLLRKIKGAKHVYIGEVMTKE